LIPILICLLTTLILPPRVEADKSWSRSGDPQRPKIGLVLSGGGALGFAHLGVLKVLQTNRVPIDLITGTSMGAIIGGLYASGMTLEEIEAAMREVDWEDLFSDTPPAEDLNFRRKKEEADFLFKWPVGIKKGKLETPRGLIQGQKLNLVMKALTVRAAEIGDFDRLAIPFRCASTDFETGEVVVLSRGNLGTAMRASMSIPGIFPPVVVDNRLLVDGGLTNNLPVDVALEMGAEIIIAVDIPTTLKGREELTSIFSMAGQAIAMLVKLTSEIQYDLLKPGDLLIQPDVTGYSSADFHRGFEIMKTGVKAANLKGPELGRLSLSLTEYNDYLSQRRLIPSPPPVVEFIRVNNQSSIADRAILSRLKVRQGQPLNLKEVEEGVARIYALGYFERVDYEVITEDGRTGLLITAQKKSWGSNILRFGLRLEDDFQGNSNYLLAANLTLYELNSFGAEWRNQVLLGQTRSIFSELYQPLEPSLSYFIAPSATYSVEYLDLFKGGDRVAEYRIRQTELGLGLGRQLGNWGEARAGLLFSFGEAGLNTGEAKEFRDLDFNQSGYYLSLQYDQLDDHNWPRQGAKWGLRWFHSLPGLGSDEDFQKISFKGIWARTFGRNTFILGGSAGFSFNGPVPVYSAFRAGGLLNLSGLHDNELIGQNLLLGRIVFYREMGLLMSSPIKIPIYLGGSLEAGNIWEHRSDIGLDNLEWSVSAFIGTKTFLGPIYLAYGYGGQDAGLVYFYLGRPF
jgi:NTE family protein